MSIEKVKQLMNPLRNITSYKELSKSFLWTVAKELDASQGAFFTTIEREGINYLKFIAGYAYHLPDSESIEFEFGEGLSGQVAKEGKAINIQAVPDGYITILSGLGNATPNAMYIFPIKRDNKVIAVIELASFKKITKEDEAFIAQLSLQLDEFLLKCDQ